MLGRATIVRVPRNFNIMRAFVLVSLFVALATSAPATPVDDHEKRQIGTYDYIVIGVSTHVLLSFP